MQREEFLYCTPTVFVIGNEYEILINLKDFGICFVKIGDKFYYEENSGVLPSERTIVKIRVPQKALDDAKEYEIIFRQTDERKGYWSTFLPPKTQKMAFKPLEKTENINIYYISDVHYKFEIAKQTVSYFGDDVDLYVINGDIGEVETVQNYLEVCVFVGDIAKGTVPVLFSRGNHDTRGHLAELFTDYFPCQGKNTYYTFEIGCLNGIVLDCGEDKPDYREEYDSSKDTPVEYLGVNRFHEFRERELDFLKNTELDKSKINIVVSHVCPAMTTGEAGGLFDIDRELYTEWCAELDRIDPAFMLCGHFHSAFLIPPEKGLIPHKYTVVVGDNLLYSKQEKHYWGTAIVLNRHKAEIMFTDETHCIKGTHVLQF